MAKALQNKVALVTGGSRGIGRAICERLARDGATVVVNYVHNKAKAEETVANIRNAGGHAVPVQADVAKLPDIRRLFEQTVAEYGRIDIFVNNAGIFTSFRPIIECTEEDFDRTFSVNARGAFFCLQQAARHITEGGRIVCISSSGTRMAVPTASCYMGSKSALEQFVRILAQEIAPRGVTVNTVSPGFTETEMLTSAGDVLTQQGIALSPFKRLGHPDEIAGAVSYLVSAEGAWITGQNIQACGGIVMPS
ncbi:MAG TPA: glucose 1-dehydrogenase [Polyangia bacterium]|jgi:3-oxoacyl-[acyl-carrier protein] reductase|nr:glucose 1-dehydrogenase [Polyangia bacterium]